MNMRLKTDILQHDRSDCAAACIASIARHYGCDIPLALIREASGTTLQGATVQGVLDACSKSGFKARAFKSAEKDPAHLKGINLPAILHILKPDGVLHFVVLFSLNGKKAVVMDPAEGKHVKISISELSGLWTGYLVTVTPEEDAVHPVLADNSIRKPSGFIKYLPFKEMALMLAGSAVYMAAGICTALFLQHIIDSVIPSGGRGTLAATALLMLAVMVCTLAVGFGRVIYSLRIGVQFDARVVLRFMEHLFRLPADFFSRRGAGELYSRIRDISDIRTFLTEGISSIMTSILVLAVSFTLMFTRHWRLSLLMLTFIPIYLFLYLSAGRVSRKVNRDIIESSAAFEEKAVESLSSARMLKHFGGEGAFLRAIEKRYVTMAGRMLDGGRRLAGFASASDAVSRMMSLTLLTAGSIYIFGGTLTVGELVSFWSLTSYFSAPLGEIVTLKQQAEEAAVSAERVGDLLSLPAEDEAAAGFSPTGGKEISFRDISFSYPGRPLLLRGFDLTLKPGCITAIQGESGCGKSTLAALLMRDFKPSGGVITLGETDISLYNLKEWRRFVSIVPQEPKLMNCSILDNITCLDPEPDLDRAAEILRSLGLTEFIRGLPMGILTDAGEGGCILSGGQRQRIALARALYAGPEVLILDEATSSLDETSQRYILDAVKELRDRGRTVMMITHKADNAAMADTIVNITETDKNKCALGGCPDA